MLESKYIALAEVVHELRFLQQSKALIISPMDREIVVYDDDETTIKMTTNRFSSRRT